MAAGCAGFCFGRAPNITAASLSGPASAVEVRSVDGSSQAGGYLMGAIIIPVKPLAPYTTYTAAVTLAPSLFPLVPEVSHQWSFTTGAPNPLGLWKESSTASHVTGVAAAPRISNLRIAPRKFRAATRSTTVRSGTVVSYNDSAAAMTTLTVVRVADGRRRGRSCVAPSRATRARRRCTRLVSVNSLFHRDRRGHNAVRFGGRIANRPLSPGSYRLRVQARASGLAGPVVTGRFQVAR